MRTSSEDDAAPPSDIAGVDVVDALVRGGRWSDAADYYRQCENASPRDYAALLIAAGRFDAAHSVIAATEFDEQWAHWDAFLRQVDDVLQGNTVRFPDLVASSANFTWHWATSVMMLRVAEKLGQIEVAGAYARTVLGERPWDVTAATARALNLIQRDEYLAAVDVAVIADMAKRADEVSSIERVVDRLRGAGQLSAARAFAVIGYSRHKQRDLTQPVSTPRREMQARWQTAYRATVRQRNLRLAVEVTVVALCVTATQALLSDAELGIALVLLVGAARRARPIAGLDRATSKTVRSLTSPWAVIRTRRYDAWDVLVFVIATLIAISVVLSLVPPTTASVWVDLIILAGAMFGASAVWARRRHLRRGREAQQRTIFDPAICRCLELASMCGRDTRAYVDTHLFDTGGVPSCSAWRVRQCLGTHTKFLDLPTAALTIRLPPPGLGEHSLL